MRTSPSIAELKSLCLKHHEPWVSRAVYRKISIPVTWTLVRVGFTPNQVTWASAIFGVVGLAALVDPLTGRWWVRLIGLVLLQWSIVLDHVDGEVARAQGSGSPGGYFLDNFVMEIFLHVGMAVALAAIAWSDTDFAPWAWVGAGFVLLKALSLSTFLLKGVVSLKHPAGGAPAADDPPAAVPQPLRQRVAAYWWEVKKVLTWAGLLAVTDALLVDRSLLPVVYGGVPWTLVSAYVGLGVLVLGASLVLDVVSASRGHYMTDMEPYR